MCEGDDYDALLGGTCADVFVMSKGVYIVEDFDRREGDRVSVIGIDGSEYEGIIVVIEDDFGTILRSESGNTMYMAGAMGSDVYNLIVSANEGQLMAHGFDVLA